MRESKVFPIVDCHFHFEDIEKIDDALGIIDKACLKRLNLLSRVAPFRLNFNVEEIYVKAKYPGLFSIFGALDYCSEFLSLEKDGPSLVEQVDRLMEIGFDGVKMLEGKPIYRRFLLKMPFDSDFYEDYFKYLESLQIPMLFHVADGPSLWDPEKRPAWAVERGYIYDEIYPTREQLYTEVEKVLERHPKLKVIFAHFYFISHEMEKAENMFNRYRNVHFDITPEPLMYYNFSDRRDEWREFFIKYRDRLLFGTDNNSYRSVKFALDRIHRMRKFLESDEPILWTELEHKFLRGLSLPERVFRKIYFENFERIVGKSSKKLNLNAAIAECRRIAERVDKFLSLKRNEVYPIANWHRFGKVNEAKRIADLLEEM